MPALKDPQNITLLLIPYLTVCGVLYHVAYWSTFGLNGLSYIAVSDIIKSSIQPIIHSGFWFFVIILRYYDSKNSGVHIDPKLSMSRIWRTIVFIIWIIVVAFIYRSQSVFKWSLFSGIFSIMPAIYLTEFLENTIKDPVDRMFLSFTIILGLASAFGAGKTNSDLIFKNVEYKYIKNLSSTIKKSINTSSDTLKFIGSSDKYLFFTDLNNTSVLMLKDDKMDTLIIFDSQARPFPLSNLLP